MAQSKFSLDGPAFEESTRQVIQPDHVMPIQEAGVQTQLLHRPPGLPTPQEEQGDRTGDAPENSVLECVMEDAGDHLHAFQEYEHYFLGVNSGSDCDVPEDELTDEMEDIFSDEDQLVPVNLQEEEGPTEGNHDQSSPVIIPVDDTIAIEENIEPSVVDLHVALLNVEVTEPEDPSIPKHLDEMEDIVAIEEDQLVPVNSQEEEHFTEEDHDQLSLGSVPLEDISAIEGNEASPVNLHVTLVNVQVTEPKDPSTPRRLDFNIETFDSVYPEAAQKLIPENQLDVKVQTVTTTSAAGAESSSSSQILMGMHVDRKPPEPEDNYELLLEAVNGDSTDLKDVNETPLKRAIEAGAQET